MKYLIITYISYKVGRLSLEERDPLPLPAAWDLRPHHKTKLPNVRSYHQPKQKTWNPTQLSQPDQSQTFIFLIQTVLLRANLRKSYHPQQLF